MTESSRGLSKWRNRSQLPHRPPPIVEGTPERIRSILRSDFDADRGSPVSTRLVLLHIMKTGGTSLSDLCSRWARPGRSWLHVHLDDLLLTPRPLLARLEFLGGHIPFEALSIVPGSFVSATVLRDPVERAISHYAELVNSNPRDAELTLDEFVSSEVYDVPSGNYQARQLALSISVADAWVSYSPEARYLAAGGDPDQPFPLQSLFDSTPIFMSDQELFNIARANLDAIDYVGVTDDLYSLASALAGLFDTNLIDVPVLNRAKPFDRKQLTNSVRKRLEIRTAVDRELYDLAAARSATNDD